MSAPTIEFHLSNSRDFAKVRSNNEVVRFRIVRRVGHTVIDGDWFCTKWELARSAWREIQSAYNAECATNPCHRGDCGGGRSCVIVTITPDRETHWRQFLSDLLSRPEAWLVWDGRRAFVPQTTELEPAA